MMTRALMGCALAASIALLPTAGRAQQAPEVKVKVDDLDLTKDAGVKTATSRLKHGVEGQCAAAGQDLHSVMDENACRKDLLASGRSRIAAAAAKSDADRLAEERHLAEVSIHPRRIRRASDYHRTPGHVVAERPGRHPTPRHPSAPYKVVRHAALKRPVVARHAVSPSHRKRR